MSPAPQTVRSASPAHRSVTRRQTASRRATRVLPVSLTGWLVLAGIAAIAAPMPGRASDDLLSKLAGAAVRPTQVWADQRDWVTSLAFLKDGRLAVGTYEELVLRDAHEPKSNRTVAIKPGYLRSLSLSPDGALLAVGHYQTVTLVDTANWSIKRTLGDHAGYVAGTSFSPDGQLLAVACEDETARVWSLADNTARLTLTGHSFPVQAIAFSPDGKRIATAAGDETRITQPGEVRVWNAADGKEVVSFKTPRQAATGVAFSPDGKMLASTGFDERVILYDLVEGKPVSYFAGHSRPTNAVLFSRDGRTAFSAAGGRAKDGNDIKVWERDSGTELATLAAHTAKVDAIALAVDESLLASGGYDKAVAVWDVKALLRRSDARPRGPKATDSKAGDGPRPADEPKAKGRPKAARRPHSGGKLKPGVSARRNDWTAETPSAYAATEVALADDAPVAKSPAKLIRVGIIGLDTSHAGAFARVLNDKNAAPDVAGFRVVAAYPRGSADIKSSTSRVADYTREFIGIGVDVVDSIEKLLEMVDVVLLETNDGRPHLEQVLPVLKSGKRVFIDKPVAGSLADAVAIFEASKHYGVPVFSSSSLRYGKKTQAARNGRIGAIRECSTESPAHLEKTHPDLFWYGIHGVESLFTVMGTGCQSVRETVSTDNDIFVVGTWREGRTGTFHGTPKGGRYGGLAKGSEGTLEVGQYEGYRPLVVEIVKFFRTGVPPVSPEETLEIYAFMEAADESKRQKGAEITLESVLTKARAEAAKKAPK